MPYDKICVVCGHPFTANRLDKKVCSKKCGKKNPDRRPNKRNGLVEISCEYCGILFKIDRYRLKNTNHFFCSLICHGKWNSIHRTGVHHPLYILERHQLRICPICGKSFINRYKSIQTCSKECGTILFGQGVSGENNYQWTGGMDRNCLFCGRTFHVPRPSYPKLYCSKSCAAKKGRRSANQVRLFDLLKEILNDSNLVMEKTWDWLRFPENNRVMYVDIYSPRYNLAIEYDGAGHFRPDAFGQSNDDFETTLRRDATKSKLLNEYGINFLRYNGPVTRNLVAKTFANASRLLSMPPGEQGPSS